jgi:hypothetical protein
LMPLIGEVDDTGDFPSHSAEEVGSKFGHDILQVK